MNNDHTQEPVDISEEKTEDNELERLQQECEEYRAGWQRAQADYQNLQREMEKKRSEWVQMSEFQVIETFLPVYDHLKKALESGNFSESSDQEKNWAAGIKMIVKQFEDILAKYGMEQMQTVGELFDPERHEALSQEVSEDQEEGTIIKEVESGYTLKDRVVRPAKVIVSKK